MSELVAVVLFVCSVFPLCAQENEDASLKESYRVRQEISATQGTETGLMPIHSVPTTAVSLRFLRRLLSPLRSSPFLITSAKPCCIGLAHCFAASNSASPGSLPPSAFAPYPTVGDPSHMVSLQLRTEHAGPLSHRWLEVESSYGKVTIGYGPATLPFIDAGQVSLQDGYGNIERITGIYPVPVLGPPPINYHYARAPGYGRPVGKPVPLTLGQADALIQKMRSHKFVGPYIPIFHDCRTFACSTQAKAQGHSSLLCYLLLKGYW